jgi:hypothetical protein
MELIRLMRNTPSALLRAIWPAREGNHISRAPALLKALLDRAEAAAGLAPPPELPRMPRLRPPPLGWNGSAKPAPEPPRSETKARFEAIDFDEEEK